MIRTIVDEILVNDDAQFPRVVGICRHLAEETLRLAPALNVDQAFREQVSGARPIAVRQRGSICARVVSNIPYGSFV